MKNIFSGIVNLSTRVGESLKNIFKRKATSLAVAATAAIVLGAFTASATATPVFNSNTNDYPTLQVAKSGATAWGASSTVSPGDTVNLFVWDHNSVPDTTANNTSIKVTLPSAQAATQTISASVYASNAATVTGTATLTSSIAANQFKVSYVAGSAKFLRNVNGQMTQVAWPTGVDGEKVVTTGVNLGDQQGCWQFAQGVLLQVKIEGTSAAINTNKKVALAGGTGGFVDTNIARPGDAINYRIFVENTGSSIGVTPKIVDTLDAHLSYVPNTSYLIVKRNNTDFKSDIPDSFIKFEGQKITWALSDMNPAPDAAVYLYFQTKAGATSTFAVGDTQVKNTATVTFAGLTANTNTTVTTITRSPEPVVSFTLRKEVTNLTLGDSRWYDQQLGSAAPGDLVAYRLVVSNTGNVPATNVTLKDILPSGLQFMGGVKLYNADHLYPNGVDIPSDSIVKNGYTFPTLANGNINTQTIVFNAKITTDCNGNVTLTNNAQVLYLDTVQAHDDASLIISCTKGLIITKDILDPVDHTYKNVIGTVHEGDTLTYRINVQNNGNVPVTTPIVRDVLPPQVAYLPSSLTIDGEFMKNTDLQSAFVNQGMILTDLNPGMGKVITFQVKIVDCPPFGNMALVNTAFAKATQVNEISDTATATLEVRKPVIGNPF